MARVPAMAQVIRGTITDAGSGMPVPVADVRLFNGSGVVIATTVADTSGHFQFAAPFGDSLHIQVSRIGYSVVTSPRYMLERGELLEVNVHLSSQAVALEAVSVVARRPADIRLREFYERATLNRKLGRGKIWMREDIERESPVLVSNLLDAIPTQRLVGCRGGGIFVDNLPVSRDELNTVVQPDDIEGIEIYRDAEIPFEYGTGNCIVMLIWRKPYGENGKPVTKYRLFMLGGIVGFLALIQILIK